MHESMRSAWALVRRGLTSAVAAAAVFAAHPAISLAHTELVSSDSNASEFVGAVASSSISANGQYIAFQWCGGPAPGGCDPSSAYAIYVKDRRTGSAVEVDTSAAGVPANGNSSRGIVSDDGRYVAFLSQATNLVPGASSGLAHVYRKDRQTGAIVEINVNADGSQPATAATDLAMSGDGQVVAWLSDDGTMTVESLVSGQRWGPFTAQEMGGTLSQPTLSPDGTWLAWTDSDGSATPPQSVYEQNLTAGAPIKASVTSAGGDANGPSSQPSIANHGIVAFSSSATNLTAAGGGSGTQVFVHEPASGATTIVSTTPSGDAGDAASDMPSISSDGRFVAFESRADNMLLPGGDTNGVSDVFVRDMTLGETRRASLNSDGSQTASASRIICCGRQISASGRWALFFNAGQPTTSAPGDQSNVFIGDGLAPNAAPTPSFTVANGPSNDITVDGRASADPDGWVTSYSWTFGDGATAIGAQAHHAYASRGTYTVTLTVTDNESGAASSSRSVTVGTKPPPPPSAPPKLTTLGVRTHWVTVRRGSTVTRHRVITASFRLSAPSRVFIAVSPLLPGVLSHGRCVAPPLHPTKTRRHRCLMVRPSVFSALVTEPAGRSTVVLPRTLDPGTYRLNATVIKGKQVSVQFVIPRRPARDRVSG